ncbi:hypothetical protein [Sorangium sp. So ce117]|uniref:hypothetical protein n=1 Tax=Sorangium sp. So ce117 TaxID=3133277 RepID=UPI003F63F72E
MRSLSASPEKTPLCAFRRPGGASPRLAPCSGQHSKDGKIKQVWLEVEPKEHASAILAAAKS